MNRLEPVREWLQGLLGLSEIQLTKVFLSLATLAVLVVIRAVLLAVLRRRVEDVRTEYRWKKATLYLAFLVAVLVLWRVWFQGFGAVATYFGLLSAGLAIALHAPLVNLAGWVFIMWRRPFEVGDRIEIGGRAGDVIDLRIFQFTLLEIGNWVDADQSTGRIIHVPNGKVFSEALASYTKGFSYIWNEIPVLVTFESDWRLAKKVLMEIADKHASHLSDQAREQIKIAAQKFMILYSRLTPKVYTSVEDSGVLLTLRYLCEPRRRRGTSEAIWEDILAAFEKEPSLDFAYPTQRFYRLPGERPGGDPNVER